ncbi:MAG TPA: DUF6328 family protein [Planctomycetota bacterium]|nr:DUF6328 family protein [Planctomycetota bacterium]
MKIALDECRMLSLVAQVLVGFLFRACFEPRFDALPESEAYVVLGGLGLMLIALGLIVAPSAYHRIVMRGEDSRRAHAVTTRFLDLALLPFALGLGVNLEVAFAAVLGRGAGIVAGVAAAGAALAAWYGVPLACRRGCAAPPEEIVQERQPTPVGKKIEQALTEARTVLPGAQALLGFQFITVLMRGFERLPASAKEAHLASLAAVAVAVVFLMLPAAFHRIVERGEDTERFHAVAGACVLVAMAWLALGLAGDTFVVALKVTASAPVSIGAGAAVLALYGGLWFGYTLAARAAATRGSRPAPGEERERGAGPAEAWPAPSAGA